MYLRCIMIVIFKLMQGRIQKIFEPTDLIYETRNKWKNWLRNYHEKRNVPMHMGVIVRVISLATV